MKQLVSLYDVWKLHIVDTDTFALLPATCDYFLQTMHSLVVYLIAWNRLKVNVMINIMMINQLRITEYGFQQKLSND